MTKTSNYYETLRSYISDLYPDPPIPLQSTFSSYPHLQKMSEMMTNLLNESNSRILVEDETQLIIRSISILCAEMNDISLSEMQSDRVIRQKRLDSDANSEDADILRDKLSRLHQQTDEYEVERQAFENQVNTLKTEIHELKEENFDLEKKFNELKRMKENEVSKLTVENESLGDRYSLTLQELKLETSKGENLAGQIDNLLKDSSEKSENIEQLTQTIKKQQDLLKKSKSIMKALENRAYRDKDYIKTLKNQIKIERSRNASIQESSNNSNALHEENILLRERMIGLTESNEKNLMTINELIKANNEMAVELERSRAQVTIATSPDSQKSTRNSQIEQKESEKKTDNNKTHESTDITIEINQEEEENAETNSTENHQNETDNNQLENSQNETETQQVNQNEDNKDTENNETTENENQNGKEKSGTENTTKNQNETKNDEIKEKEIKINESEDSADEMRRSLNKISALFKKSKIRPSELPKLGKQIAEQESLINKLRSIIDAQVRFILTLIERDYAMPHILDELEIEKSEEEGSNGCKTSTIFKDEQILGFIKESVEKSRQAVIDSLNGDQNGIDEILIYESIFKPEETGIDLLIDEMEKKGADNEMAALAVLLSVILKQRKILESDAKFIQSIYSTMPIDFDHPQSAQKASEYVSELHEKIQSLKKFYHREFEKLTGEIDDSQFLAKFLKKQGEFSRSIKKATSYNGKLYDLPKSISKEINVQERDIELDEQAEQNETNSQIEQKPQSKSSQKKSQPTEKNQSTQSKQDNQKVESQSQQESKERTQSKQDNQKKQNKNKQKAQTKSSEPEQENSKQDNQTEPDNQKKESNQIKKDQKSKQDNQTQQENQKKESNQIKKDQKSKQVNQIKKDKKSKQVNQNDNEDQLNEIEINEEEDNLQNIESFSLSQNDKIEKRSNNGSNQSIDNDSIFGEHVDSYNSKDAQVQKLIDEKRKMKKEIKLLKRQLGDAKTANEVLQETFTHFHDKNAETEKTVMVIIAERDRLQKLLNDRNQVFDERLKKNIDYLNSIKDNEIATMKKRYEDEIRILNRKLNAYHKRIKEIKRSMKEISELYEDVVKKQQNDLKQLKKGAGKTEPIDDQSAKIKELQDKIADLVMIKSNDISLSLMSNSANTTCNASNMQSPSQSVQVDQNALNEIGKALTKAFEDMEEKNSSMESDSFNNETSTMSAHSLSRMSIRGDWTKEKIIETIESIKNIDTKKNEEIEWRRWAYDILARYGKIDVTFDDLRSIEMRIAIKSMIDSSASRLKLMDKIDSLRTQKKLLLEGNVDIKQMKMKKVTKPQLDLQTMKSALLVILSTEAIIKNANKAKLKKPQPSLSAAASPRPAHKK